MFKKIKYLNLLLIFLVTTIAFGLRDYAIKTLYIDFDEPIYLSAALEYTNYIREGKYTWLSWNDTNLEHPSFFKIIYGFFLLDNTSLSKLQDHDFIDGTSIQLSDAKEWGMDGRRLSMVLGTLTAAVLSMINPLAGFFIAVNTLSVKYTSQFYLESLPLFTSLLSVISYCKFYSLTRKDSIAMKKRIFCLFISSVSLGITAASKYIYCVAGIAIIIHFLISFFQKKYEYRDFFLLFVWLIFSFFFFFIFNPYLWPHPITRLIQSLTFHINYPNSEHVKAYNYPVSQPIYWLMNPFKYFDPKPESAFIIQIDTLIFGLAVIGLPRTFKTKKVYFIWFWIGLLILLLWGTKWPQYALIIIAPYCLMASQGLIEIVLKVKNFYQKFFKKTK
jgi:hypothetical protein